MAVSVIFEEIFLVFVVAVIFVLLLVVFVSVYIGQRFVVERVHVGIIDCTGCKRTMFKKLGFLINGSGSDLNLNSDGITKCSICSFVNFTLQFKNFDVLELIY